MGDWYEVDPWFSISGELVEFVELVAFSCLVGKA